MRLIIMFSCCQRTFSVAVAPFPLAAERAVAMGGRIAALIVQRAAQAFRTFAMIRPAISCLIGRFEINAINVLKARLSSFRKSHC